LEVEKAIPRTEADGTQWMMTYDDFSNRVGQDTAGFASTIKGEGRVKLLCVHGRSDQTIPYSESEECAEAAGAELAIVDGDHNWRKPADAKQMIAAVVEFATRT